MKTIQRTDCHSPASITPADYEYVAQEHLKVEGDLGALLYIQEQRRIIREHMARTGGTYSKHEHGGNCMVCGSVRAIYTVLFYHAKTNSYVRTGQECAQIIDRRAAEGLEKMRDACRHFREFQSGKKKAKGILAEAGIAGAWDVYEYAEKKEPEQCHDRNGEFMSKNLPFEEQTIWDIVGKLIKYGSSSDNQIKFLRNLMDKIANRAATAAKIEAEKAAAPAIPEIPEGRVVIEGIVLSTRAEETMYGETIKMLVKDDRGFKLWGSAASKLLSDASGPLKGCRVRFAAQVERSKDDKAFGFYKRPTQPEVLAVPVPA